MLCGKPVGGESDEGWDGWGRILRLCNSCAAAELRAVKTCESCGKVWDGREYDEGSGLCRECDEKEGGVT